VYEPVIIASYRSKISDLWFSLHACDVTFYGMQCSIRVVQVELPLRLINYHVIKTCRRLELQIRAFIAQETGGGSPTAYL
jgi:hypothetical protein